MLVRKPEDFSLFTLTLAKNDTQAEPIHACISHGAILGATYFRAREEFYIQNPESRIDELLNVAIRLFPYWKQAMNYCFNSPPPKISAPNSKYNCCFAQ
jgi:hypothetical protein